MKSFTFIFLFAGLLSSQANKVPGSFMLRWSPEDATPCEDAITKDEYETCIDGKLFELDGSLYGRELGRSSLFCNPQRIRPVLGCRAHGDQLRIDMDDGWTTVRCNQTDCSNAVVVVFGCDGVFSAESHVCQCAQQDGLPIEAGFQMRIGPKIAHFSNCTKNGITSESSDTECPSLLLRPTQQRLDCRQYFETYHGTLVMELSFQSSCGSKLSVDGADSYWTVVHSKVLPYGTKIFDEILKGKITFGAGMIMSDDRRITDDVFYGILFDTNYVDVNKCEGCCGSKSEFYDCWCDEECSYRGDCCYDVCKTCSISCEEKEESGCRNSCSDVMDANATCSTWGFKWFEHGDTCDNEVDCGLECTLTDEYINDDHSVALFEGPLECTQDGMKCLNSTCECDEGGQRNCLASSSAVTIMADYKLHKSIRIDELNIGDKVMAFNKAGNLIFDEVYYIYHDIPWTGSNDIVHFVNIGHMGGSVRLTCLHQIYLTKTNGKESDHCIQIQNNIACTFAANIAEIGDTIWVKNGDDVLEAQTITSLSVVYDKIRSPVTIHGNIIVDNVAVSAYSENHAHDEAGSLPLRILNYFGSLRWIMATEVFQFSWEKYFSLRSDDILWESEIVTSMTALGASDASTMIAVVLVYVSFSMLMLWK